MSGLLNPAQCQAILESLPNGIYVVDRERKILFWNEGAEQITGYRGQEVIGRHCQDNLLMHCNESYQLLCGGNCPLQDTMFDGQPREANVFLRHKEGHRVPVRVRAVPVRDAAGAIVGAAEIFEERREVPELHMHPNALAVRDHKDERTGVSDEASTLRYLEACLRDYGEDHIPFAVLLIAIDRLDYLVRSSGTQAVAKVMHMVAATLAKTLREGDIVGDWSDSRFLALVLNCPAATLAQLVFMLKRVISVAEVPWWGEHLGVTVSIGGAAVRPGDTASSLLARAERALAACMEKGGDAGDLL
jgi:PAS domain S-box-containing protein/diguanylate cyclase (GGDEF)-like protein